MSIQKEPKILFGNSYVAFWDNGTLTHSDGVGYCDEASPEEVLKLYEAMRGYYQKPGEQKS